MRENSSSTTTAGVDTRPCGYAEQTALLSNEVPYRETVFSGLFSSSEDSELTSWTEEKVFLCYSHLHPFQNTSLGLD